MRSIIFLAIALFWTVNAQAQSLSEVIADFVEDGGNAYQNATMKHTRDGSGHFEDIEYIGSEFYGFNNAMHYEIKIVMSSSEDWRPIYDDTEKVLKKLPMIRKDEWKVFDLDDKVGKRYYYEKDAGHSKSIELFWGDNHAGEKKIVGINLGVICRSCEGGDVPNLSNIPKGKGYSTNILPVLQTEEGKKAFLELLASADNDFEDIIDFSSKKGNVYQVKESLLNPKSEFPFIEVYDFPERRELRLTPHREKGEYGPIDVIILFQDYGYADLFVEPDWVSKGGDSFVYEGGNAKSHLAVYRMLEMETGFDYKYDYCIIESIKKSSREANDNNSLIPSDLHPKAAAMLGCKSGDCKDGFGTLLYLDPVSKGEIHGYVGHFKNGVFDGSGVYYNYVGVSTIVELDTLMPDYEYPELEKTRPDFIGYFKRGKAVMAHQSIDFSEMELCKKWNRHDDCEKWQWTLDQYNEKEHRFSIYTFATRGVGQYKYDYSFIQHQTFDNGKTVRFDKPFQADFGKCISGDCKGGYGKLQLEGIGTLEADFDAEGVAADESFLTLLSGEVYETKSIKGIPISFRRVSVPTGISWKKMARCGAWIMLQENTCLEGDCRNGKGIESIVKNKDGSPKRIPGYFSYEGGLPANNSLVGTFTAYYHTGVENEKFHRKNNPDYDFSFTYADYYDVQWNADKLHLEKIFKGDFSNDFILKGKYEATRDGKSYVCYYKDDIRYAKDMQTPYDVYLEKEAEEREKEFDKIIDDAWQERKRKEAEKLAAQGQKQEKQSASSSTSSSTSPFSSWINSQSTAAGNAIFARPGSDDNVAADYGITNRCSRCGGFGVCSEKRTRTVKVAEESMLFYSYTYKQEEYEEMVTCPVCRGTGEK